jgi:hypothetical protein
LQPNREAGDGSFGSGRHGILHQGWRIVASAAPPPAHQLARFCPMAMYGPAPLISKTNVCDEVHHKT